MVWADRAYAGKLATWAKRYLNLNQDRCTPEGQHRIRDPARRWVVERSLAWMMNARRHARDYERLVQHSETLITWAAITLINSRLTRGSKSLA
ncbi:transposase [Streptomyces sioyaensis]|uniref:transposase n=1 Tax=Streptomyces sioyaensis TaxID=67364 RepID=UPI0033DFC53D